MPKRTWIRCRRSLAACRRAFRRVPATRGGTFQITSEADVTLPGFVFTDLLWTAEQRPT
jgi:hypothetical protein